MSDHNNDDVPVPSYSGAYSPSIMEISNDEEMTDTPSRRAAGPIVFDDQRLKTGAVDPTGSPVLNTAPVKQLRPTGPSKGVVLKQVGASYGIWSSSQLSNIPTLPPFCTLEPTAVFVPDANAARIATRISTVLCERSMEAHAENAKASCTTLEGVDFCIRFYRGRGPRYSHGIIVEVQRRYGTSLSFHNDTVAILNAAEDLPPPVSSTGSFLPAVVSDSEEDHDTNRPGTLEMVEKMFMNPGTHRLALETLATFTNESKMGSATARKASKELLEPNSRVGAQLVSLVIAAGTKYELRAMALEALGNALLTQASLKQTGGNYTIPTIKLRTVLQQELLQCERNPRMAYLAARCLQPLLVSPEDDQELQHALQQSVTLGQARHMALAREASKCLGYFP